MRKTNVTTDSLRKDRLLIAKDYRLYYGFGKHEELSNYDIAIVEPKAMTKEKVTYLQHRNTLVIAYLSIVEVHPTEPIYTQLTDDDFLKSNGQRIKNNLFGTYLVNLKSKRWVNYLLESFKHRLMSLNADGIFMDTIGDLDMATLPETIRVEQLKALTNFLYIMKLQYPHHVFIQNNGLETVCKYTIAFIDGILWENPPLMLEESQAWVTKILNQFDSLNKENSIKVFLLFEDTLKQNISVLPIAKKLAKDKEFLIYHAPEKYIELN